MDNKHLKKSMNTVKRNDRKSKLMIILSYLIIWVFSMIVFWFFTSDTDVLGFCLLYLWIIFPVTSFVLSVIIGKNDYWGHKKWLVSLFFGIMYMLAEYGTFSMANNISSKHLNEPEWGMILIMGSISIVGLFIGDFFYRMRNKTDNF